MKKTIIALTAAALCCANAYANIDLAKADHEIADKALAMQPKKKGMLKIQDGDQGTDQYGLTYMVTSTANHTAAVIDYDWENYSWTELTIPSKINFSGEEFTITEIGAYAFQWAAALQRLTLPSTLTGIGDCAFMYCQSFTEMVIPEGVTYIGTYAFYMCVSMEKVNVPEGVTTINECTFANCTGLTEISIPESVTTYDLDAFYHCNALKSFTVGKNVTTIVNNPWGDCWDMKKINVNSENPAYCDVDGVVFSKDKSTLVAYSDGHGRSYAVPEGTVEIGPYAFYYAENLASVTLPESLTAIGPAGFMYCNEMSEITIPSAVERIDQGAFYKTTALKTFKVSADNPYYKAYSGVLYNTAGTVLINFPCGRTGSYSALSSTYAVADFAFSGANIEKVILPAECELLGPGAFYSAKVSEVTMPGVTDIYDQAFYFCYYLKKAIIPANVQTIGAGAYQDCVNIEEFYSYASKAPSCAPQGSFDNYHAGLPLNVVLGCATSYRMNSQFKKFDIIESLYRATATFNAEKGTVDVNGQGASAVLELWEDMQITITPNAGVGIQKVLANGEDVTADVVDGQLYIATANKNFTIEVLFDGDAGVADIDADTTPATYYDLNGIRVDNPANGIFIKRQGTTSTKVLR